MTTLNVNTITPAGNTLTLGESGDTVVVADDVKVNTVKDAGGNTLWVSDGSGNLSSVGTGLGGAMVLISTQTFTNQASVSITSGIDSTYKEYVFKFININPATDSEDFRFQVNAVGESGFNETITSTQFQTYLATNGTDGTLAMTWGGQSQGDSYNDIGHGLGNSADENYAGELHLFNPASTTYVKNFYGVSQGNHGQTYTINSYFAGYINTALAIDEISFKMDSGNMDGIIKMYGIVT